MENLHCHSVVSDGKLTYQENLTIAEKFDVKVVAFTDHDSLPSLENLQKLRATKTSVRWITGIEISAVKLKELGNRQLSLFHILGLFVDTNNKELLTYCTKAQAARIERMERMIKNLQELGFQVNVDDCLKASGGEVVGRPHIVQALQSHEENKVIINGLVEKMRKAADNDVVIKANYEKMLQEGEGHYPYALFLTDEAFIKGIFVNYLYQTDMDEAVGLIRNAGGVAILAHYYSVQKYLSPALLEILVATKRLDGLEQTCGLFAYGGPMEAEVRESRIVTKRLIKKYGCLETGGMDSHSSDDWKQFAENKWYSQETEGMLEKMLATKKVRLTGDNCNFS